MEHTLDIRPDEAVYHCTCGRYFHSARGLKNYVLKAKPFEVD